MRGGSTFIVELEGLLELAEGLSDYFLLLGLFLFLGFGDILELVVAGGNLGEEAV